MSDGAGGVSEEEKQPLPKVLIVDDSRMVRASLIKHIRERFDCREEADGEAAWETLVVDPSIDVVLTDIGMPRLDGFGLLERIRGSRLARLQHLPVVVISGDEDDAARERACRLGANDFITKGTGSVELIARIESLTRLGQTRRELEESRAALARQSPLDPTTGLATESYLNRQGAQAIALARRQQASISAMVMEIDRYEELSSRFGPNVAHLVARKLSKILSTKIRQEDTVAQLAPDQFAVLSPVTDAAGCSAFALRMQMAIEKLTMTYREERIRISVTIGIANSAIDGMKTVSHLIGVAVQRMLAGKNAGGNRVVSDRGEVTQEMVDRMLRQTVSLDRIVAQLRMGDVAGAGERVPAIVGAVLPLLEFLESQLHCGIPLERLKREQSAAAASAGDGAGPSG